MTMTGAVGELRKELDPLDTATVSNSTSKRKNFLTISPVTPNGGDWDLLSPGSEDMQTEDSPSEVKTPVPAERSSMEFDASPSTAAAPPRSPWKKARMVTDLSSSFDDHPEGESMWISGENYPFDRTVGSQCNSPTTIEEGGRLSFGRVLDLSGTSEPRIGGMDLSGVDSNTSHEDNVNSHNCAGSPLAERAVRMRAFRSSHRGTSPSRTLNLSQGAGLNSSFLSNVPTVKRCITPDRSGSPIQPLKLFGSQNGQVLTFPQSSYTIPDGASGMLDTPPLPHQQQQAQHTSSAHVLPPAPCPRRQSAPMYTTADHPRQNPFNKAQNFADVSRWGGVGQTKPPPLTTKSFLHDFMDFKKIGTGCYGEVYSCTKKLDLCQYAVKEIKNELRSERERERILREIYALATQGDNVHAVRFFSAWEQDGKLYIQTELCSSSLAQIRKDKGPQPQPVLLEILLQVAVGLAYLHASNVAHLDIKPENIYTTERGIYKIGDFGLATVGDPGEHDDEGDKRYLSWELLQNDRCDLFKADVFALGVTVYEMASAEPLPGQGDEYHALRNGTAPMPPTLTPDLQHLLGSLLHPDPAQRPSASELVRHPLLHPLLRDESAACLRASPQTQVQAQPCTQEQRLERDLDKGVVAKIQRRALKAEEELQRVKEENRMLKERLAVFQQAGATIPPCVSGDIAETSHSELELGGMARRMFGSPAPGGKITSDML